MTDHLAALARECVRLTQEWGSQPSPQARTDYFAKEVAPVWVPVFREVPFRDAPEGFVDGCDVLISLVGVSWQPAMLMAARLRPTRLVLLTTEESAQQVADGTGVRALMHRFTGISVENIILEPCNAPVELDVYRVVQRYRARYPDARILIDPTGGLKSMASAVALAGFLYGLTIVYIDSDDRDVGTGMPVLGSEYPRVLHNPLEVLGDLEFRRIEEAFNAGRYTDAAIRAADLKTRLLEQNQAEVYRLLALLYGAWDRFHFQEALEHLKELSAHRDRLWPHRHHDGSIAGLLRLLDHAIGQQTFLQQLCDADKAENWEQGVYLLLNHLAAARRRLDHDDASAALLLLYATVERCVGLRLRCDHKVNVDDVDWDAVPEGVREGFHQNMKTFVGTGRYVPDLPRQLSYATGIALNGAYGGDNPAIVFQRHYGWMKGLAHLRNHCEFEHGFVPRPADRQQVAEKYNHVHTWLQRLLGDLSLDDALEGCRFPRL